MVNKPDVVSALKGAYRLEGEVQWTKGNRNQQTMNTEGGGEAQMGSNSRRGTSPTPA